MVFQFRMLIETPEESRPDLVNPLDEILEEILVVAKGTLERMGIAENVKPVNNLSKWF